MKNYKVVLEIEIENNHQVGITGKFNLSDMLFTDLDRREMDSTILVLNARRFIKLLNGFSSITVTSLFKGSGDFSSAKIEDVIKSVRFVSDLREIKSSEFDGHKYNNYQVCDQKFLYDTIKELCLLADAKMASIIDEQLLTK
jgi:hypothetical protein